MNRNRLFLIATFEVLLMALAIGVHARKPRATDARTEAFARQLNAGNLLFTENKGQVMDANGHNMNAVLFTAHDAGARIFLTATGIQYQFAKASNTSLATHRFSVQLVGANVHATIRREQEGKLKENFYLPNCPQGITNVSTYSKLVYEDVYPGINWVVYARGSQLEYDFVVKPGADASKIRLHVQDANGVTINKDGELVMKTSLGEVREHAPVSFAAGKKVPSRFIKSNDGTIGFEVVQPEGEILTIDPTVQWATYFGGAGLEVARASSADTLGNVYVSGWTNSTAAVAGAGHQITYGGGTYDAFLVKFDAAGNRRWATYYGGTGTDYGYANAVTASGDAIYLAGVTSSTNAGVISTAGAHQVTTGGGNEGYLVRFDSLGVRQWGTYYGGSGSDNLYSCSLDGAGNVYISGYTASTAGIATTNGFQQTFTGSNDGFLAKFSAAGVRLWGTYFGGTLDDRIFSSSSNGSNIYIAGYTSSTSGIATTGVYQPAFGTGSWDMFAAQFDTSGARKWSTYYGGTGSDYAYGCAAYNGGLYLSGYTSASSTVLATTGAYQTASGGSFEAVLAKLDTTGNRVWGTFFGGAGAEYGYGCSLSPQGDVYICGYTTSAAAIASNGVQNALNGTADAYIAKFSPAGDRIWSSYFGGPGNDTTYTCAAVNGAVYIPGFTGSTTGIATTNAYQTANSGGNSDVFIARISDPLLLLGNVSSSIICSGSTLSVPYTSAGAFNTGNTFTAQLSDSGGSFANPVTIGTSTAANGTVNATIPAGTIIGNSYRVRVVSSDPVLISKDNGINIAINSVPASPAPITGSTNVCTGSQEKYAATSVPNTTSYTWTLPATWTGASTADTIQTISGATGGNITVTANNACGSSTPASLAVTISTLVSPGAVITASDSVICAGELVTFSATALNGGTAPAYQWKKNGVNVGTNSSTYSDAALNDNDTVYVVITSNSLCVNTPNATSNKKVIQVDPVQNPAITVTASPGTTVAPNQTITFTANAFNAGTSPTYQWYVSGSAIAAANSNTFTVTGLAEGDAVSVKVRRNAGGSFTCSTTDSAVSPALTIHVLLGITNASAANTIRLYPNPSNGLINVSGVLANAGGEYSLDVCNTVGQVVQHESFTPSTAALNKEIHLNGSMANGLYYLQVRAAGEQKVITFSLNR